MQDIGAKLKNNVPGVVVVGAYKKNRINMKHILSIKFTIQMHLSVQSLRAQCTL
jgi:hypothetical protein